MQLVRLHLINFRQHQNTDIRFGPGLTGIVGPNGAGKTTLLEGIANALYGVPGTRGTKETLRRRGAPPRARFEVTLEFTLGIHPYAITRTLTSAELTQDSRIIANSTGAVTAAVTKLLGMSRYEFFNTYFTGQKELAVMAVMGPTERAQFLSRVMGFDRLRDAQDRLRDERSGLRSQLAGIEQGLSDPEALEAELQVAVTALETSRVDRVSALRQEHEVRERMTALAPGWTTARERRAAWQSLDGERRLVEQRVAVSRTQFQALDQQLAQALHARTRLAELGDVMVEWQELTTERELLDGASVAYTARSRSAARRDEARRRLDALEPQRILLPDPERVNASLLGRTAALGARDAAEKLAAERRTRWTEDVQEARTKLTAFRERYKEIKEQRDLVEKQGPDGICPTCGRPLGNSFTGMLELLARQMEEVLTDGTYYGQRVAQLTDAPQELKDLEIERQRLEQELRRATDSLAQAQAQGRQRQQMDEECAGLVAELGRLQVDLSGPAGAYDVARHEHVRARLAELEASRREHDQLSGVAIRAETLGAEAASAESRASTAEAELVVLDQRLTTLGWDATTFTTLETEVRAAEMTLQAAQFAVAAAALAQQRAEELREAALTRQADRAAKAETARRLGDEINLLDELDRAFSDLRTELNLQLRPDLQDAASHLLHDLTAGRYGDLELDESYVPTVVDDGEAKPVISGGEEDVVNLAMRLAISQMIADRAGKPLSLLVLDEIFGSLDEDRRASVLTLLRALSDRFPQVILITHVEGMHDAFDRVIRMSYDVESGVTTVRDDTRELLDVAV
ncbi:MAG: AAA family ATPase [Gemmatimonadales bacterium]